MLEVRLLGQFDVQRDGTPLILPSRLAQSLFAYLVLTAGTSHRREKLAGLLWPDTTDENARRNLRQELWRLRKAIEPHVPDQPPRPYFLIDDITLAFNPRSAYWLDASVLAQSDVRHASAQQLIEELALYRGELLPGFYDEWAVLERERTRSRFEQKIVRLLDLLVGEERWNDVLEWSERWIAVGRSPEPAFRALMTAQSALGDRSRVAATFERCTRALWEDLNVEPSPQTQALFEQLLKKDFPPHADTPAALPLSSGAHATHLPIPLSSFIGREYELGEIRKLLSTTRLLTLTGAGGVGKTRLAIRVAADLAESFRQGIGWVELAALADGGLVPREVANALGVREIAVEPLERTLANYLRAQHLLLVLDNCEHLIQACAELADGLLRACPDLKILTTSREPLGITGESIWRVPSLTVPALHGDLSKELTTSEAVRLWVNRAQAVRPGFDLTEKNATAVAEICRRLDGIPLAIELAAARVPVLSPEQIAARLDDQFSLLTSGGRTALPRHQTLRALIDWSYNLLSESERVVFRRLSVFAGGFTLEAAEAICADDNATANGTKIRPVDILDLLTRLVSKSLVLAVPHERFGRYRLLETIRQYARVCLEESGETKCIDDRHLAHFLDFAWQKNAHANQADRLNQWQAELDNLRVALQWAIESHSAEQALRLACALGEFWFVRGHLSEARSRLNDVLAMPAARESGCAPWRARALSQAAKVAVHQSEFAEARSLEHAALEIFQATDDRNGTAASLSHLFLAAFAQGDYESAKAHAEQCLVITRELGDEKGIGTALKNLGMAVREAGDYATSRALMEKSLAIRRQFKNMRDIADSLMNTGATACAQGDPMASALLEEALAIFETLEDKQQMARCLHELAIIAARGDHTPVARARFSVSLSLFHKLGDIRNAIKCLEGIGGVCAAEGDAQKAAHLYGASEALRQALGTPLPTSYRADYERNMAALRHLLDNITLAAVWAEGRGMTIEQAVEHALKDPVAQ